jgi:hypothetical protein
MSDQVADVLDDAADLLERGQWIQHLESDGQGGRCAFGAIEAVAPSRVYACCAESVLLHTVDRSGNIASWNDAPGRTKQQVLDAFRAAAKQERMRPETPAPPRIPERDGAGTGLAGGDAETRTRPADESHPPR